MATTRKDYAAIAASKIHKPGQKKRAPRLLVYGRNKKGKTRFCTTAPDVLILDPETGTEEETKSAPDVWPLEKWEDIHDAYQFVRAGGVSPVTGRLYRWVALDGATRISNMALRWVMSQEEERSLDRKPGQVGKQDYGKAGEMFKGMLLNFHSLRDIGIIITAQERMIESEYTEDLDEDADTIVASFVPDLPKGARSAVNSMVDLIGRIYIVRGTFERKYRKRGTDEYITKMVDGIQRRLWVGPHAQYDTGYRSEFTLPDYLGDPTVPRVIQAMREGKT